MKRFRKLSSRITRGLLSLIVLFGVCAMLFPLPVSRSVPETPGKDASESFPCQNRPCGCRSAEQCWKKCCCFNHAQKIAWAKTHNVKVPDFVLAAARKERVRSVEREICSAADSPSHRPVASAAGSCCERCQQKPTAPTNLACCTTAIAKKPESCSKPLQRIASVEFSKSRGPKTKWVLAVYAAECQGQTPLAFSFPASIVPERITLVMPTVLAIDSVSIESERLQQASLRPPLPPPKIV